MQIDAIVTDLDDTLLSPETTITPYTLEVFQKAMARGIRVIPASGRTPPSMRPFVTKLNTGLPYIASNGAELVDAEHNVITAVEFSPQQAQEIVRYLKKEGFYVQCYYGESFYYDKECGSSASYKRSSGMRGQAVGDLASFIDFPTPKVLSVSTPQEVARLYPIIQRDFPQASFTVSKPYFLEAEPLGVSKGAALIKLAEKLKLSPEHTLVFGDSLNDLTMLQYAKHSVAMGNAREEIKQAARYVCGTNAQDGPARFIDEHVLSNQA